MAFILTSVFITSVWHLCELEDNVQDMVTIISEQVTFQCTSYLFFAISIIYIFETVLIAYLRTMHFHHFLGHCLPLSPLQSYFVFGIVFLCLYYCLTSSMALSSLVCNIVGVLRSLLHHLLPQSIHHIQYHTRRTSKTTNYLHLIVYVCLHFLWRI